MDDQLGCKTIDLKRILKQEDMPRAVRLRGLPRDVQQSDVKEFFADFDVNDDNIHIEMRFGNRTGWGLVLLNNEEDQQRARQELNKQYIGSRYVDVMIPRPEDCGDYNAE